MPYRSLLPAAILILSALAGCATPPSPAGQPPLRYVPYLHIVQGLDPATHRLRSVAGEQPPAPLVQAGRNALPGRPREVVWAFASGECGAEDWGPGIDATQLVAANAPAFAQAGMRYRISTGGQAGVFTCASEAGMQGFVQRYASPALAGFDFDIEGSQTDQQLEGLVRTAAASARAHPEWQYSFTLATLAGSDVRGANVNATGAKVVAALQRHHFDTAVVNLMVMDFGPASAASCVLRASDGRCDMGRSGLQAALNLQREFGVPLSRIALTAMLGVNDVTENVFTPEDAALLLADARTHGLAGVYYWSLERDAPCPGGATEVSSKCHSLPGVPAGAFGKIGF
ncbi:glycosyl hydrolase [Ideonella azotifigens]|uniref:Glycosyl hydrolase n=1 Tax=Ideonella azotifigens TaxID=513160 RepID=A0ABN1KMT3_9BURK|nr:glycosyl hydrolase [Ideonella azotifigens]MCD2343501.1 glycosyl hydrolase [Ideonella azotifigens]